MDHRMNYGSWDDIWIIELFMDHCMICVNFRVFLVWGWRTVIGHVVTFWLLLDVYMA